MRFIVDVARWLIRLPPLCRCPELTGGGHEWPCPYWEQECACYEMTGGHMPGCAMNRAAPAMSGLLVRMRRAWRNRGPG